MTSLAVITPVVFTVWLCLGILVGFIAGALIAISWKVACDQADRSPRSLDAENHIGAHLGDACGCFGNRVIDSHPEMIVIPDPGSFPEDTPLTNELHKRALKVPAGLAATWMTTRAQEQERELALLKMKTQYVCRDPVILEFVEMVSTGKWDYTLTAKARELLGKPINDTTS